MSLDERTNRILTTHVGSLPRSDALSAMMADGQTGTPAFEKAVREALDAIVRKQAELGIDVVDDGEQSKPGFVAYVLDRLAGFTPRDDKPEGLLQTRESKAFPEFYNCGHSGSALPRMATMKAIAYVGQRQLRADLDNLKAALRLRVHPARRAGSAPDHRVGEVQEPERRCPDRDPGALASLTVSHPPTCWIF